MSAEKLQARVHALRCEADDIISLELHPIGAENFPPFEAGAHIDLHLPNGMLRSYSLANSPSERHRYLLGVLKEAGGRGGSRQVHDLRIGTQLAISAPRNNFPLHELASHSLLVAGGIGITPILSMARRLKELGRSAELLYLARSRRSAAFVEEVQALGLPVTWHFDDQAGGPPDLAAMLRQRGPQGDTHYYACGPGPMLRAFEETCDALNYTWHLERFAPVEIAPSAAPQRPYTVDLRKSGKRFEVAPGGSLRQSLIEHAIAVPFSCCEGVCGSCETKVLEGEPEHRDSVLTKAERESNKAMMVCVSGCKSEKLVLDL